MNWHARGWPTEQHSETPDCHTRKTHSLSADLSIRSSTGAGYVSFTSLQVYCNSIGCPNGYAPIDNTHDVECDNGYCAVSQCCHLFCNAIGCPDGYTPIKDVLCVNETCTVSQYCEAFCSYHPCPNN